MYTFNVVCRNIRNISTGALYDAFVFFATFKHERATNLCPILVLYSYIVYSSCLFFSFDALFVSRLYSLWIVAPLDAITTWLLLI